MYKTLYIIYLYLQGRHIHIRDACDVVYICVFLSLFGCLFFFCFLVLLHGIYIKLKEISCRILLIHGTDCSMSCKSRGMGGMGGDGR